MNRVDAIVPAKFFEVAETYGLKPHLLAFLVLEAFCRNAPRELVVVSPEPLDEMERTLAELLAKG
jgi:hypothetical protein